MDKFITIFGKRVPAYEIVGFTFYTPNGNVWHTLTLVDGIRVEICKQDDCYTVRCMVGVQSDVVEIFKTTDREIAFIYAYLYMTK